MVPDRCRETNIESWRRHYSPIRPHASLEYCTGPGS